MTDRESFRSLPLADWPEADWLAWEHACCSGTRLTRGGAAAHLKEVTRADLARRYSYFLDHVSRTGALLTDATPAAQVTAKNVQSYLTALQGLVSSVTAYGSIYKLRRVAELIAPYRDLSWLKEIEADLDLLKVPRSKYPRLVTTTALVEAGLTLSREAELDRGAETAIIPEAISARRLKWEARRRSRGAADRALLDRAVLARNGLMQALLALCPIRIKNFAALELNTSLQNVGETWWIVLEPKDTKSRQADERPVPDMLAEAVNRYVEHHRIVLSRGKLALGMGALWVSETGAPMSLSGVEHAIRNTTRQTLGVEIGPHMFRTAAATTSAVLATHMPGLASAVLQHRDRRITEAHYNRATTHQAAQALTPRCFED